MAECGAVNDVSKQSQVPGNPLYLPLTDALNGWWQIRVGDGIGLVSLRPNSNSETHMTVICDARLIHGRGGFHRYLYAVQL